MNANSQAFLNTPHPRQPFPDELRDLYLPNILIEGDERAIEAELQRLIPLLTGPVHVCRLPGPLHLPDDGGALILRNVGLLDAEQQSELFRWLESPDPGRVVSMNSSSLFDLVLAGVFSEQLYYRLNTMLEVTDGTGRPAGELVE